MYRTSKHRDILRWIIILVFTKSVGHGILFSAKLTPLIQLLYLSLKSRPPKLSRKAEVQFDLRS